MAKRRNGEGTVSLRADGKGYEGRLRYIDENGDPQRYSGYSPTEQGAWDKLAAVRQRHAEHAPLVDSKMRLADWLVEWAKTSLEASSRSTRTKSWYRNMAKHAAPLGHMELGKIKPKDVDLWMVTLRKEAGPKGASKVKGAHLALRVALDAAVKNSLIAVNPVHQSESPSMPHQEAIWISVEDVADVLDAAVGSRFHDMFVLCFGTAIRDGELCAVSWKNIDLDKGRMRITQSVGRTEAQDGVPGKLALGPVKTARSRRAVPLSPDLVALLRRQRALQAADRLKAGERWVEGEAAGLVFRTEFGTLTDPANVLRAIKTAAAKTDIVENVVVHTLRHSAAVAWLEAGVHYKAVSDLLGHSSSAFTLDKYGHTSQSTAQSAVDVLSDQLREARPAMFAALKAVEAVVVQSGGTGTKKAVSDGSETASDLQSG